MDPTSESELVSAAKLGDASALETLLESVRDHIYRLSLRMLTTPSDAEDATQEILLRALTRLSTFRGDARFSTWVHRIAVNHLLDHKRTPAEQSGLNFDLYAKDLAVGLAAPENRSAPEIELLAQEVRLGCTQAMLVCLDRDLRITYVLGEIFEVSSDEGAFVCEVTPATYRKRLSRARSKVRSFLSANCGIVNPTGSSCRCKLRIETAVSLGRINADAPVLSNHRTATGATGGTALAERKTTAKHDLESSATRHVAIDGAQVQQATTDMEDLSTAATLMRSHPDYLAPDNLAERISGLIRSGRFGILNDTSPPNTSPISDTRPS